MDAKLPLLSIVCPAFEEAEVLPLFHAELAKTLDGVKSQFEIEIIYVDDGSADDSLRVLKEIARADNRVHHLSLSRNFGKEAALTAGLDHARGDLIVTMDSDLQHPPNVIPALLQKMREGFDVVMTHRAPDSQLGILRRLTSNLFYRAVGALRSSAIPIAASDFQVMSRKALNGLLRLKERHRFLRCMVPWVGFRSAVVAFQTEPRRAGVTKYGIRSLLRLAVDAMLSVSTLPLRLALYAGLVPLFFGVGLSIWLVARLAVGLEVTGWQMVLASVHVVGGAILVSLGILGEYVGRIFEQVKERPLYLIKENSMELRVEPGPRAREAA